MYEMDEDEMDDDEIDDDEMDEDGIDIEDLREALRQELYGAYYGGGFDGAMMESFDVDDASPAEIIRMAEREGIL